MAASQTTAGVLPDGPVRVTIDFPSHKHLLQIAGEKVDIPEDRMSIIEKLMLSQLGLGGSGVSTLFAPHGTSIAVKVYDPSS